MTHPEFAGRPNTTPLNTQTTTASVDEGHGTAVSSVLAAPTNGVGLEGVYPQARLQAWDISPTGQIDEGLLIQGILAAADRAEGVINVSIGGASPDFLLEEAVLAAFGEGSLVVASAGNSFLEGNPAEYPADYEHVLTIGATTETDTRADFSSTSLALDLAAPGQDIPVAVPVWTNGSGYDVEDGTSFAAPLVSGAAAWAWTARPELDNTQLFDLLRWTARDVGASGWDPDTGYGVLNIASALSAAPPPVDPQEPNEDIYLVKPHGLFRNGTPFIVGRGRSSRSFSDRLDYTEDPEDVFRVWVPAHKTLVVNVRTRSRAHLALWGPRTRSVFERGRALRRDLVALGRPGKKPRVSGRNSSRGAVVAYIDVWVDRTNLAADFSISARLR